MNSDKYRKGIIGLVALMAIGSAAADENTMDSTDQFQRHMYMGIGFAFADMKEEVNGIGSYDFDNVLMGAHFGYQFHQNLAVEFRGYGNVEDDDLLGVSVSVDRHFSLLGKAIVPLDEHFKPYFIAGVGRTKVSTGVFSNTESNFVYGVGFALNNGNPVELEVEWTRIYDDKFSIVSAGTTYHGKETISLINLNLIYHFPSDHR